MKQKDDNKITGIYPVSEFCGINTSQTNPADENMSFISFTFACISVQ